MGEFRCFGSGENKLRLLLVLLFPCLLLLIALFVIPFFFLARGHCHEGNEGYGHESKKRHGHEGEK